MTNVLRIVLFALIVMTAGLLTSNEAEALLPTHQCTFCHSLHGSSSTSSLVPQNSPTNIEVLCLGCHLTANGATDAVQPHRTGSGYAEFYVTCSDCHNIHDNMQNWRFGDPSHADGHADVTTGVNVKMIGTEDPDGNTPYAVIRTREKDFNQNGIPDRGDVTQTCDTGIVNDCYTTERRYVIFEQAFPASSLHAWVDNDEDGLDPAVEIGPTDPTVVRSNESDSGALTSPDNKNWSAFDSLCQMCHTQTAKHNPLTGAQLDHNNTRACTDCHRHDICFDRGGSCSTWTVPNRNLQVDTVSAAPTSVNAGQSVTITVDVTNLGDNVEDIDVRYSSDIEGTLGFSTVTDVAPSASDVTSLDWITVDAGTHTVTANIVPVIGETVIANNSGTDIVTVTGADLHDVAVTSVSAPSPIQEGNTETVSVALENLGTFTESPFDVTLVSDLDGTIGTLSSGSLAPGATPTLDFSWNTTGATLGSHTLTATSALADDVPGNDSANTAAVVAIHDVAVTTVTAPPSVDQGTSASVDVDIANLSDGFTETFNVTLYDDTDTVTIGTLSSGALAASGTTTLNFSWNTTGASIATHTLRAVADTVTSEIITANNTNTTTSDVIEPVTHDVGIVQIQTVGDVEQGTTEVVLVDVWNYGGAAESFDVTLSSDQDGSIDSPQTVSNLAIGTGTTVSFNWTTGAGTTVGAHTLTATTTLGTDTIPGNNTATTGATILEHDLSMVSITDTPDPVTQGGTVTIEATVTNLGDYAETFDVTLTSDLDDLLHTWTNVNLGAGATTTPALTFDWDTTLASTGTHTLTATAATVANEFIIVNNSATTTNQVDPAAAPDVAITATDPGSSCKKPCSHTITITVENVGTGPTLSAFNVTLYDDTDGPTIGVQSTTGLLGPGASEDVVFTWATDAGTTNGVHSLRAVADTVTGESITANNTAIFDSARVK